MAAAASGDASGETDSGGAVAQENESGSGENSEI